MIFDNIHHATPSKQEDWQTCGGRRVLQLQSKFSKSRVVYSGCPSLDMKKVFGLCTRLGLWQKQSKSICTKTEFLAGFNVW